MLQYFTQQTVWVKHRPGRLCGSGHDSRSDSVTSWTPPGLLFTQHSNDDPLLLAFSFCSVTGCDQQVRVNCLTTKYHKELLQSQTGFSFSTPSKPPHNNLIGTIMKKMWLKLDDTVHICLYNRPEKWKLFLLTVLKIICGIVEVQPNNRDYPNRLRCRLNMDIQIHAYYHPASRGNLHCYSKDIMFTTALTPQL